MPPVTVKSVFLNNLAPDFRLAGGNRIVNETIIGGVGAPAVAPPEPSKVWQWVDTATNKPTHYWNAITSAWVAYAVTPTTVSNAVSGIGLTRSLVTTVNGVSSAAVFIPDQNNSLLSIGGTATAPTISNDGGVASVALPAVPPTSNTLAITKAGGAVSTVQGVAGSQAIPAGTIVETLGYNAAGAAVYQVIPPVVLDGNDKHIVRLNATAAAAPTTTEVATPIAGDTAKVILTDKSIEYWSYNGTAWTKDYTDSPIDDIVDVTGVTLPIVFPVATLPGTPVFTPATPASATAVYAITNGTAIVYAKWNGTQYISAPAPAPSPGHFRSGTGTTGPDGVNDPTENVARSGKTGLGIVDPSGLQFTSELDGTIGIRQAVLANATTTCTIPAAITSSKASIVVTQTALDAVLLFAAANIAAIAGQRFTVINSDLSTNKISYLGYDIHPNQCLNFVHTGRMWQIEEVGINSEAQLETAVTVLPTSTTALNSFTVVAGGIQSSTTSWVEVPGTSFVAASGGEYLVKYVAYSSCSSPLPVPVVNNGFRIAVGSNISTGSVQVTVPATGRVIETSQSLITNLTANQIDSYTKTVIVKVKPGETIQLQMNSLVGSQVVYQSATQNSRLEYAKIVNTAAAAAVPGSFFSSSTAAASVAGLPDGTTDLTEKIRRDGSLGILADAASTFDVAGSIGWGITQLVASATAYAFQSTDSTLAITGGAGLVQNITTPSALAFPRRVISLQMPEVSNYSINLASGGGNIEFPDYSFTGSARLSSGAVASLTWQSDGIAWRLISYVDRKFYSTQGYTVPSSGFTTFNGAGGVAPAAGVAFQIPAGSTSWQVLDGNYTPLVALPTANNATGRFSIYANNASSFDTTVSSSNTDLPRNTVISSGQGRSMHFEWSDGLWRWCPAPEPLVTINGLARWGVRGTYAAPLTGVLATNPEDELIIIANGASIALPAAAANLGRQLVYKKPGVGTATITGSVDGAVNLVLSATNEAQTLRSDGATWNRI